MKENAQEIIVPLYNSTKEENVLSDLNIRNNNSATVSIPITYVGEDGYLYILSSVSANLYRQNHGASGIGGGGRSLWATADAQINIIASDGNQNEIPYSNIYSASSSDGTNVPSMGYRNYDDIMEVSVKSISLNLFETALPYGTKYLNITTTTHVTEADDGYSHYGAGSIVDGAKATYLKLDMKENM